MKLYEASKIYSMLSNAHMTGMTAEQKYKVLNVTREFKKPCVEFEDFVKDTRDKVTDEKEANEILNKEFAKEVEIKCDKLGDTFDKLIEANDWVVNDMDLMEKLIK